LKINISKLLYYSPLKKSKRGKEVIRILAETYNKPEDYILERFAIYLGALIKAKVKKAIKTQRIKGRPMKMVYPSLSESYKKRKNYKNRDKFYLNTEMFYKELKAWKRGENIYIGFPKRLKHKNGAYLSDILVYLEKGTSRIPPRPLFSVVVTSIAKNIIYYLYSFVKKVAKNEIKL